MSPNTFLPSYITSLFPDNEDISILDVGAGPLTSLEKRSESHHVTITAVDALGREYDMILKRHGIDPPVKTQYCKGEDISNKFAENSFDFVYARNSIDHCDIPEKAILGMLHVLKKDCYILLEHRENEAERGHYQGFHQWNFSEQNGKFIIKSKYETIDFSEKHKHICQTTCLVENGDWLVVKIRKL
ncbi:MAG: class I SAM-dependent methyltransferase [Bacteroidales bacterium]|nr:class I SAM-dependent methyltransferase [Bacteroidales bacterium]